MCVWCARGTIHPRLPPVNIWSGLHVSGGRARACARLDALRDCVLIDYIVVKLICAEMGPAASPKTDNRTLTTIAYHLERGDDGFRTVYPGSRLRLRFRRLLNSAGSGSSTGSDFRLPNYTGVSRTTGVECTLEEVSQSSRTDLFS